MIDIQGEVNDYKETCLQGRTFVPAIGESGSSVASPTPPQPTQNFVTQGYVVTPTQAQVPGSHTDATSIAWEYFDQGQYQSE